MSDTHHKQHVSICDHEEILNETYLHPEDGEAHVLPGRAADYRADEETARASPEPVEGPPCAACRKSPSTYETFPCRCNKFCKKCAMKMATGGKCKTCHQLFASMTLMKK